MGIKSKKVALLTIVLTFVFTSSTVIAQPSVSNVTLTGAGATFPYPLISKWINEFQKVYPNITVNYQPIGSGGGIQQIIAQTVDFAGSDAPLNKEEYLNASQKGTILHIPETIGALVIAYNLPGIDKGLKLSGDIIADIYLGKISRWNDPRILELNMDLNLPDEEIIVVKRSDGSGTTYIFTDYLSKVSEEWSFKIGVTKIFSFPKEVGDRGISAKGNQGVAGAILQNPYSIGYIEFAYAIQSNISVALLRNRAGNFVQPNTTTIRSAAASAAGLLPKPWESWENVSIVNAPGELSYPISSFSYILVYREQSNYGKYKALLKWLTWIVTEGQKYSESLHYVPLPSEIVEIDLEAISTLQYVGGPPVQPTFLEKLLLFLPLAFIGGLVILYKTGVISLSSIKGDKLFEHFTAIFGYGIILLVFLIFIELFTNSLIALGKFGINYLIGDKWDPVSGVFGALPFIFGTFYTSSLSLLIALPVSIGIAIFITEIAPTRVREILTTIIELIAAIPSVIIGLWGIFYLAPIVRDEMQPLLKTVSFIPLFTGRTFGLSYLTAVLVLTVMITPIMTSIYKEAFQNVPRDLKEALYALGATRYEVVRNIILPYTKRALLAGLILAYGRALGETLAVTMVIGNKPAITLSLLSPGYTLAAVIANEFLEATNKLYISSLIGLGLILFLISFVVNLVGEYILGRMK